MATAEAISLHELCERFRRLYLPAVSDALYHLGIEEQVLPSSLRPLHPEQRIVGEAFTLEGREIVPRVAWEEGIERMRPYLEMFERLTPDSVLVHTTPAPATAGHFGELTGNSAKARGCQGVILDGNVRDIERLGEAGFQVFYRDLSPLNGIGRWEMTSTQQPVTIGGDTAPRRCIVHAEFDGILVVPRDHAVRVLEKAEDSRRRGPRPRELVGGDTPWSSFERHGYV